MLRRSCADHHRRAHSISPRVDLVDDRWRQSGCMGSGPACLRGRSRAGCLAGYTPGYGLKPDGLRLARLYHAPGARGRPGAAAATSSRPVAAPAGANSAGVFIYKQPV